MRELRMICAVMAALLTVSTRATIAEMPADGWSGQLQCAISVRAPGYQDDQTHTWVLSGAPIVRSDFRDYPATWTVTGAGNKTATAGPGGAGMWTRTGSDTNASITIFIPAGTTNIRVAPGQRAVAAAGGLRGTLAAAPFSASADEWRFQYFDTPGAASETHFNGSRTQMLNNPIGWRQPAGAQVAETCTWSFTKGGSAQPVGLTRAPGLVPSGSPTGAAVAGGSAAAGKGLAVADAAAGGAAPSAGGAAGAADGAASLATGAKGGAGAAGSAAGGSAARAGRSAAGVASSTAGGAATTKSGSAQGAGAASGSAASSNASGGGSAAPPVASAVSTVDAAVAPSGPVSATFSGPTSLTIAAPGTYQLVVRLPMSQTTVVTENQPPSTTSTPTTQTLTNVSIVTQTTTAFVIDSGEVIFTAAIYQYNQAVEKQSATVVLSPTTSSPPPAVATFKFTLPGTRSVSVVASVVVERHDVTQRTVTTRTTFHDSTCNCSDRTNTSANSEPQQTQVSGKTVYMIGAPPAAPAALPVVVQ